MAILDNASFLARQKALLRPSGGFFFLFSQEGVSAMTNVHKNVYK